MQELELDHQAGKLTDEDAERERQTLRDEAVAALAELESLERGAERGSGRAHDRADLAQALPQPLAVARVERDAANLRVHLVQPAQLAVLARDVALAHRGDLEVEVELGQVEVGRDRLAHAAAARRG